MIYKLKSSHRTKYSSAIKKKQTIETQNNFALPGAGGSHL
jgi:hypothetical protein